MTNTGGGDRHDLPDVAELKPPPTPATRPLWIAGPGVWRGAIGHHGVVTVSTAAGSRHPHDPEPVPSTKASAAYGLSLLALATSPFIGGVIPACMALSMCAQADADIVASDGFLLGAARSRKARKFAYLSFGITVLTVLAMLTWWLFRETAQSVS